MNDQELKEYAEKYKNYWWLDNNEDIFLSCIENVKFTCVISDNEYTEGYLDACNKILNRYREFKING